MVIEYLEDREYAVDYAADGVTGLHLAVSGDFDVIVLDLMLPGLDGVELCRQFREQARRDTPILMLTARDTLEDKLTGLEAGADDYLVKPFAIQELETRIRAMIRRKRGELVKDVLTVGELVLDASTLSITRAGKEIVLTPIALKILMILMRVSPKVVSRQEIEREIWGELPPDSDTLRSHLYTLRKALDKPFDKAMLETIPTLGYRIVEPK